VGNTATIDVALAAAGRRHYGQAILRPDGTLVSWSLDSRAIPAEPAEGPPKQKEVGTWNGEFGTVKVQKEDESEARKSTYWPVRVIPVFWYMAVMFYLPIAMFRRRIHYRVPMVLMGAQMVWGLVTYWGTTNYQRVKIDRLLEGVGLIFSSMSHVRPAEGWAFLWLFVFAAVGFSIRVAGNREKWGSLEILAQGGFFNRAVAGSIAAGLLSGVAIAALPYLVALSRTAAGASMEFRSVDVLTAPMPVTFAWSLAACVPALGLFGFAYPLALKVRSRYFRWALFAPVGIAIMGGTVFPPAFQTPVPNLAASVLLFAAYTWLYLRWDLLAAMSAMVAAQSVLAPCVLLAQPSGSVRSMAVPLIGLFVAALAVSLHAAIRGREGAEAIPDSDATADLTAEPGETGRVRLAAEFDLARKAQEEALPSGSPPIEGYSLAGSCTPAQQVGGDLFDYFSLADGRVGIAVADVSGKGVPAALYMMVTKGLLAAATRDSSDLAYILEQINLHLYRASKKKVFVTLAAVALDPARRRLQHGRAGHNPTVWRRTRRGETVFLKPPGLGLGMTSAERFNRVLKIEELELEPGDAVVLYSDGITEAVDARMEQFGEGRLLRSVEKTDGQPAEESRAAILRDLADFVGSTPARDDITLVVLRVAEFAVA
jgi:hypothetical protein